MRQDVSPRQAGILCFIMLLSSKILALPSLLYQDSKNSSIFILFFLLCIELFFIYIFIKLKEKYIDLTIFEILSKYLGKFLTKIIILIFFIYFSISFTHLIYDNFIFM